MANRRSTQEPGPFALAIREEVLAELGRRGLNAYKLSQMIDRSSTYLNERIKQSKKELTLNDVELIARALDIEVINLVAQAEDAYHQHVEDAFAAEMEAQRAVAEPQVGAAQDGPPPASRMGTPDDALAPGEPGYVAPPRDLYRLAASDEPSQGRDKQRLLDEAEGD